MNLLSIFGWFNPTRWIALGVILVALTGAYAWRVHAERDIGRKQIQTQWDASVSQQRAKALIETENNARETLRRLTKQKENQDAQDRLLSTARADARANTAAADKLREQSADTARRWVAATRDTPAPGVCEAAGNAITVQADVFSRLDRAAGELAPYADAARIAGNKCVADYEAVIK